MLKNKNIFIKDFSKFFTGAILGQIIGFGLSPILSRIYEAEHFGIFALYIQILAPLTVLSGASSFLLIPTLKSKYKAILSAQMVFLISLMISVVLISIYFSGINILSFDPILFVFLSFGLCISNLRAFLHFYSIYSKKFLDNSKSKLLESVLGGGANIGLGMYLFKGFGLIFGNWIGQICFIIMMFRKEELFKLLAEQKLNIIEIVNFIKEYKKHISFQSLNHLLEYGLVLGFSLLITEFSSIKELGYFAFCYKIINTPLNLISDYIGQAMLGRISDFHDNHHRRLFLMKILAVLCFPSIIAIALFHFYGPEIFMLVFGEGWKISGEISKVYILGIIATFIIRSLQYVPNVMNKHEVYSFFSFFTFGLPVFTLVYANNIGISFIASLEKLSYALAALALVYVISLFVLFSKNNNQ